MTQKKSDLKFVLIVSFVMFSIISYSQTEYSIANDILKTKKTADFKQIDDLFINKSSSSDKQQRVKSYDNSFELNKEQVKTIIKNRFSQLSLIIPYNNSILTIDLKLNELNSNRCKVTLSDGSLYNDDNYKHLSYYGVVRGMESKSIVSLTVFNETATGFISIKDSDFISIGSPTKGSKIIIQKAPSDQTESKFKCAMNEDNPNGYSKSQISPLNNTSLLDSKAVGIYIEVDNDIYNCFNQDLNQTRTFINGLFDQVATIYKNEQIQLYISEIKIWETPSNYDITPGEANFPALSYLNSFVKHTTSLNGDLGIALTTQNLGGGVAQSIGGINSCRISDKLSVYQLLNCEYPVYPNWGYNVYGVAHELGHSFGSVHTHACKWNDGWTAIDNCHPYQRYITQGIDSARKQEGFECMDISHPIIPQKGTVMSYCSNCPGSGVDFTLGFGPQPGNVIRNYVTRLNANKLALNTLSLDGNVNDGDNEYHFALESIISTQKIASGGHVTYDSENIVFRPGFIAYYGSSIFPKAKIYKCSESSVNGNFQFDNHDFDSNEKKEKKDTNGTISIHPNPVSDILFIDSETKMDRYQIYNSIGELVMSTKFTLANSVDVSDLKSGLYVLKLSDENNLLETTKFIKK
jgi:Metallo-peptidase family M12/Secretion system C-terminal sorting domain